MFVLYKGIEASNGSPESALIATNNLDTQLKCLFKEMDMETFMQTIESIFTMLFHEIDHDNAETFCLLPRCELVTDVCWRLSLFDEHTASDGSPHDPKAVRPLHLSDMSPVPTTLTHTIENYGESSSSGSSKLFRSVESIAAIDFANSQRHRYDYYGTLPKHKSSRRQTRQPLAATVSSNSGGSNKDLQRQGSLSVDTKTDDRNGAELDPASGSMRSVLWNRKNFTKLFATPETLGVLCLTNSKMSFAKQIIDTHNLQDRPVGKLVERIEQMQNLKNDLAALIKKNERQQEPTIGFGEAQSSDSNSDVLLDDIRIKTAKGFKISKVLSTLETFLKSQTACTDDEVLAPMGRYVARYPFLSILTGKNLQLSQIVDIIFNLPFNYELNLAIYNFLLKNSHHATSMASSVMSNSIAGHGGETSHQLIGNYVAFFGTIIDTLQISHKTLRARGSFTDFNLTIAELLSREVCPLDTMENGIVWKRRASFYHAVECSDELELAEDLERIGALLKGNGSASLRKVKQYLEHMTKLLLALHSNSSEETSNCHGDLTKVSGLIQTDVQKLVLERLFEKRISFGAMDAMCGMMGINLVQTLGKRILGPIAEPVDPVLLRNVGDGLWDFIASKSELLRQLCTIEIDTSQTMDPSSHDNSVKSPIVNYSQLVRATTSHPKDLPIGCSTVRRPCYPIVSQTELFPLGCIRPCCMLAKREGKYYNKVESVMFAEGASMEQKAIALLANVDEFAVANEWISASEHLLAAIPKNVDDEQFGLLPATRQQLQQKANELRTYLQIGKFLQIPTDGNALNGDGWQKALTFSAANKSIILYQLIDQGEYRVCAEWIKLHPIDAEKELEMFMYAVHKVLTASAATTISMVPTDLQNNDDDVPIVWLFRIIETMPIEAVVKLYETLILNIRNVPVVRYMLEYLQRYTATKPLYQKYQLSLRIFEHLSRDEYDGLWNLASR
uniref:Uncharacterized protein n=1 Tax=Anopheles maculatus TaxID=74869 RepID=A0A182SJF6_9DIPT